MINAVAALREEKSNLESSFLGKELKT